MLKSESMTANAGNWWNDPKLSRVDVVVCTANCTLAGMTYRMQEQRLLDSLNGGFVANYYRLGKDFMPLTEVQLHPVGGEKQFTAYTFVMKSGILFVAERGGGQPETDHLQRAKIYASKAKMPLLTQVWIPPYSLVGRMYVGMWQELAHILDEDDKFLPMTNAVITPALPTGESIFSFVAINKSQIVRVGEPTKELELISAMSHKVHQPGRKAAVR